MPESTPQTPPTNPQQRYPSLALISTLVLILSALIYLLRIPPTTPQPQTPAPTMATSALRRGPIVALSHGGGPLPVLGDPNSANMARSMRERVPAILNLTSPDPKIRPRAIVLVTAHWVVGVPSITSSASPSLIYDYGGFPPESYKLKYPAPGAPDLARKLADIMKSHGLSPSLQDRGWDHGVFIPLLLAAPAADIPVLQVSVLAGDDARAHFKIGRALAALQAAEADANPDLGPVAIVGSGFASFHNLRAMFSPGMLQDPLFLAGQKAWNKAVTDATTTKGAKEREDKFAEWRSWPEAFTAHPPRGAEHFMPLAVCAGAAADGDEAKFYVDEFLGLDIYSYYWE